MLFATSSSLVLFVVLHLLALGCFFHFDLRLVLHFVDLTVVSVFLRDLLMLLMPLLALLDLL